MPADETYELAVELRGEGIDQTTKDLQGLERQFEDTSDTVEDEADAMEAFSNKFEGAMGGIIIALGVAVAGLASQVPVLGELFGGFGAVLEAIAFKIDEVLRPVISPLVGALFDLADSIFDQEGAWGALIGIIGTVITVLGGALLAFAALETLISGTLVATLLTKLWGAITTVTSAIVGSTAAVFTLAAAVGAAIGAFVVWILEITGILDLIEDLGRWVGSLLPDWLRDLATVITSILVGGLAILGAAIVGLIRDGFGGLKEEVMNVIDLFAGAWARTFDRAADGVVALADLLITGFRNAVNLAKDTISGFGGSVMTAVNNAVGAFDQLIQDAFSIGRNLLQRIMEGVESAALDLSGAAYSAARMVRNAFVSLVTSAWNWGWDIVNYIADGIYAGMWKIVEAVDDTKDSILDALGFDLEKNDRMARRWGSDFVQEWATGFMRAAPMIEMAARTALPDATLSNTGGLSVRDTPQQRHAFAGRQTIEVPVILDGNEIARAVNTRQRSGFEDRARSPE